MLQDLVLNLLAEVHKYYVIGLSNAHLQNSYTGYRRLLSILEKKVTSVDENKLNNWGQLVSSIDSKIYAASIEDQSYIQFPSYSLTVHLHTSENQLCIYNKKIILNISLLCNFYTVFFIDKYYFKNLHDHSAVTPTPYHEIVYSEKSSKNDNQTKINLIKEAVGVYFPEYTFVPHSILFNFKVRNGHPHGAVNLENYEYPLYEYLFNLDLFPINSPKILE